MILLAIAVCTPQQSVKPSKEPVSEEVKEQAKIHYANGAVYLGARNYADALTNFEKAIALDPGYYEAYIGIARCYYGMRDVVAAETTYQRALQVDPQNPKAYDGLAGLFTDQRNYSEAISFYSQAVGVDSTYAPAYWGRGNVYEKLKQYDLALQDYATYLKIKPDEEGVILAQAKLLVKLGRCSEAIGALESLKRRFPEDLKVRKTVGDAYYDLKMFDKAAEEYKFILGKKADDFIVILKLGDAYAELKKYKLAETNYKKAVELKPDNETAMLKLASLFISTRRYSKARSTLNKIINLNPNNSYANLLMGDLYKVYGIINKNSRKLKSAKSNWRTAINYYQKAAQDPDFRTYASNEIRRCKVYIEKVNDELWWKKQKEG